MSNAAQHFLPDVHRPAEHQLLDLGAVGAAALDRGRPGVLAAFSPRLTL